MGGEQSRQDLQLLDRYQKETELNHPTYGTVSIYHSKSNSESKIFLKKFNTKSDNEFTLLTSFYFRRKSLLHNNLIKIIGYKGDSDQKMCSDASSVIVAFEYFSYSIKNELEQRALKNQLYSENHVWCFIQQMVDVCSYLNEKDLYHGDIRSSNIFLNEDGEIKTNEYNLVQGKPAYIKALTGSDKNVYLAPEQLEELQNQVFKSKSDSQKADVYAFGMTLLELIIINSSLDCYKDYQINDKVVENKLGILRQKGYSKLLQKFVSECLNKDPKLRPSFEDLKTLIDEYRVQISRMEPFYSQTTPQINYYDAPVQNIQPSLLKSQARVQPLTIQTPVLSTSQIRSPFFSSPRGVVSPIISSSPQKQILQSNMVQMPYQYYTQNQPKSQISNMYYLGSQSYKPPTLSQKPINKKLNSNKPKNQPKSVSNQPSVKRSVPSSARNPSEKQSDQVDQDVYNKLTNLGQINQDLDSRVQRALMMSQEAIKKHIDK